MERKKEYDREYYNKNRVRICKRVVDEYMPRVIRETRQLMSDQVLQMYEKYPYDEYGAPYVARMLKQYGIAKHRMEYDECTEIAMVGYMYSVNRCAFMNYDHVENYIKHMIKCCIKMGLVLAKSDLNSMYKENYTAVYFDDPRNMNRF